MLVNKPLGNLDLECDHKIKYSAAEGRVLELVI